MDLSIHYMRGSMIPVDLSTKYERRIYDPIRSWIQILGIRSRDPFLGSVHISDYYVGIFYTISFPKQNKCILLER